MRKKTTTEESANAETPSELAQELKKLIGDAERILVETASEQVDETVVELRKRLREKIDHLQSLYDQTEEPVLSTLSATDKRVREHPYQSLGVAVGIGVIIGLILRK